MRSTAGGPGTHLGGAIGVAPAAVAVIGAGVAGMAAARQAQALGARVVVLDTEIERLRGASRGPRPAPSTLFATQLSVADAVARADLVIGAVHVPWRRAPVVVRRAARTGRDRPAAVVDLSIDRGGCFETSRPSTLESPSYSEDGVLHHCVPNLLSATAVTATASLSTTLAGRVRSAAEAWEKDGLVDPPLRSGVALQRGRAHLPALARADRGSLRTLRRRREPTPPAAGAA